jgi:hypothetical protein
MILGGELATHFTHKATPATALLAPVSADKVHLADAERG